MPMTEHKTPQTAVGVLVRTRRQDLGLSMEELARRSGSGRSTIHRIESASPILARPDKLARVLLALDLTPADVAPAMPDDQWGRSTLRWMNRHLDVAESGLSWTRAQDDVALVAVDPAGGTVQVRVAGSVDLERLGRALRDAGYVVARPE